MGAAKGDQSEKEESYEKKYKELLKKVEYEEKIKKENEELKKAQKEIFTKNFDREKEKYLIYAQEIISNLDNNLEKEYDKLKDEIKSYQKDILNIDFCSGKEMEDLLRNIVDNVEQLDLKECNHFNIIVQGITGVGKSTLINKVLGKEIKTGIGLPITQDKNLYENENSIFRLYDTQGVELDKYDIKQAKEEITSLIENKFLNCNADEFIHCIWYLMNPNCNKYQKCELEYLIDLKHLYYKGQLPIIIVISQAFNESITEPFIENIKHTLAVMDIKVDIIKVLANDYKIKAGKKEMKVEYYGVRELLEKSFELSKKSIKSYFYTYYTRLIEIKIKEEAVYGQIFKYKESIKEIIQNENDFETRFSKLNEIFLKIYEEFIINKDKKKDYRKKNEKIINKYLQNANKWKETHYENFKKNIELKIENFKPFLEKNNNPEFNQYLEEIHKCYDNIISQLDNRILAFIIIKFCDNFFFVLYHKLDSLFRNSFPTVEKIVELKTNNKVKDIISKIQKKGSLDKFK